MVNEDQQNTLLEGQLQHFFARLTDNPETLTLVNNIQQHLHSGSTAITCDSVVDDPLISNDGLSGYIVQFMGLAGFRRFFCAEQYIKTAFEHQILNVDHSKVKQALSEVCKMIDYQQQSGIDLQWQACLASLSQKRFVLSGGPGTGKTSTVIRLMLLYLLLYPHQKIALAAPTGKAANRMMQSIDQRVSSMNLNEKLRQKVMQPALTVHRLLGYRPHNNQLSYHENNPLPHDLIIVDEASMMDVSMTVALIKALKPSAQLLLMGDKNQLPAVEPGQVFADLCSLLDDHQQDDLLKYYQQQKTTSVVEYSAHVELKKNYRFSSDSMIAQACQAVINRDFAKFMRLKQYESFTWYNPKTTQDKSQYLQNWYNQVQNSDDVMLLSAVNFGPNSVHELNEMAHAIKHNHKRYDEGMPIMVTKNDYTLDIYNGDIGYLTKKDNVWFVSFIMSGEVRLIQLAAINRWTIAHAISIHKSQGSEYDHVLIVIPDDSSLEILSSALLFTAISRAKKTIQIWCSEQIIEKIFKTAQTRTTFLK